MSPRFLFGIIAVLTTFSLFAQEPLIDNKGAAFSEPFVQQKPGSTENKIDVWMKVALKKHDVKPALSCSNDVFLRRIFLDLTGTPPSIHEQIAFKNDKRGDKRSLWIDKLMVRPEFVDYWTMKWSDLLRVKSEFPINLWPNGVQAYYRWIHDSIKNNKPYDQFVRELLTSSGSNFRTPQVNFYRAVQGRKPEDIAAATALTFMGVRYQKMSKKHQENFAKFFSRIKFKKTSEWKEEIVFLDTSPLKSYTATLPDGKEVKIVHGKDPRKDFANWLIDGKNPLFSKCAVNRLWFWLMGRGIIHEPDDICPANAASHPMLLAGLEKEFVASKYDTGHIIRLIMNSQAYQQSSIPQSKSPKATAMFGHYIVRPVEAEVLSDMLTTLLGKQERYSSQIPEPYTFIPDSTRTIQLQDGSITTAFLQMFGRPERDSGRLCERVERTSGAQRLYMLNSNEIQTALRKSYKLKQLVQIGRKYKLDPITLAYRAVLSREPTAAEKQIFANYKQDSVSGIRKTPSINEAKAEVKKTSKVKKDQGKNNQNNKKNRNKSKPIKSRQSEIDLIWALMNTKEFLFKH